MGIVGTTPADGRVLLVGDAAGLVNPLQGEGISQAMGSGRAAGEAILKDPAQAAERYRATLAHHHRPYQRIAAATQAALVGRPRVVAAIARLLTAAGHTDALAGGWAIFWNELLEGAPQGRHQAVATAMTRVARTMTARTATARWFDAELPGESWLR
jgi:flavin-dependent dehydrogenase